MIWIRGSEMAPLLRAARRLAGALREERRSWHRMRTAVDALGRGGAPRGADSR